MKSRAKKIHVTDSAYVLEQFEPAHGVWIRLESCDYLRNAKWLLKSKLLVDASRVIRIVKEQKTRQVIS